MIEDGETVQFKKRKRTLGTIGVKVEVKIEEEGRKVYKASDGGEKDRGNRGDRGKQEVIESKSGNGNDANNGPLANNEKVDAKMSDNNEEGAHTGGAHTGGGEMTTNTNTKQPIKISMKKKIVRNFRKKE